MKKSSLIIFILLIAISGYAQETPPAGSSPKDFTLPAKEVVTLENGLEIVMVPWGSIPKTSLQLVVKTGNIHEEADQVWLSDLTADMMKEGSQNMSSEEIANKLAGMGGNLNVGVGSHTTNVSSSVLYEFAPEAVRIMGDVLMNPAFPGSEIDRLKNDMKRNLSISLTQPQSIAMADFFAGMYPNHTYGKVFPTEEMIDSYTFEAVKSFYETNFGAKRTKLYVSGMFDKEAVVAAAKEVFASWPEGPEDKYPIAQAETNPGLKFSDRPGAPQSTIMMGLPVADASSEDYIPLDVTNALLGGSFGSRITRNIREDKGYTYSPKSAISNNYKSSVWHESADVTTDVTKASIQEIAKEIKRLQEEPPSKEELQGIQNYQAGIFVLQNGTPGGIINQLVFLDVHDLPDDVLRNKVKGIYAVTPEKVQELAQKYFKLEDMYIVIVGDGEKVRPQIRFDDPLSLVLE
jgi:predicted Zn-dependent peptidase